MGKPVTRLLKSSFLFGHMSSGGIPDQAIEVIATAALRDRGFCERAHSR